MAAAARLIGAGNAEIDQLGHELAGLTGFEQAERVARLFAIMGSPRNRIAKRAGAVHFLNRAVEIIFVGQAFGSRNALPESARLIIAAMESQNKGQGDFAFAEISAGIFAQYLPDTAIVKRIIDKLESNAEIAPERFQRFNFGLRCIGDNAANSAAAANRAAVFAPMICR